MSEQRNTADSAAHMPETADAQLDALDDVWRHADEALTLTPAEIKTLAGDLAHYEKFLNRGAVAPGFHGPAVAKAIRIALAQFDGPGR